ncbi:MAG: PilZ domain-containing protein [Candidatus Auribacterota bacterium]
MKTAHSEKRRFLRLDYVIPLAVSIVHNNRLYTAQGFCRNVSIGGIGLEINIDTLPCEPSAITKNSVIEARIELPRTNETLTLKGVVRWDSEDKALNKLLLGIEFIDECSSAQLSLFQYAKKELNRRTASKKWFLIAVVSTVALGSWGINLKINNSMMRNQIFQLDSLRLALESQLTGLHSETMATFNELNSAIQQQASLRHELKTVSQSTEDTEKSIKDLESQAAKTQETTSDDDGESEKALVLMQKLIDEKLHLGKELNTQLELIKQHIDRNNRSIEELRQRYTALNRALQNRLSAKKAVDQEIRSLAALSRTPMARISPTGYSELPRAMWVLNDELLKFRSKTDELLEFCKEKNVRVVFTAIDLDKFLNVDQLQDFLVAAHLESIQIHAYYIIKRNEYYDSEKNARACIGWMSDIITFNKNAEIDSQFDGITLEIDNTPDSEMDTGAYIRYMDMIDKFVTARNSKNFPLEVGIAVKTDHAHDNLKIEYKYTYAPLTHHLLSIADYLVIETPQSSSSAHNEIRFASSQGKKVILGQQVTFMDQSEQDSTLHALESSIGEVVQEYLDEPSFMGVAIHHYSEYRACVDAAVPDYIKDQKSPVISRQPPKIDYQAPKF